MSAEVTIAGRTVGLGHPCLVVAELGANHNGDLDLCLRMIRAAQQSGADIVKFQKRTPEICVPSAQQHTIKSTPWGDMSYLAYRRRLEFGKPEYDAIDRACRQLGILWTASPWDEPSLAFLLQYDVPFIKVASAAVTDLVLLEAVRACGKPIVLSTGMSTEAEIDRAVSQFAALGMEAARPLVLLHCRATYPAKAEELNLAAIQMLRMRYKVPTGMSDHFPGLWMSLCAVAMGASVLERHFTLDRTMWGTDQAASTEPQGFRKLVEQIRRFESARGDGQIRPYPSETPVRDRLRRVP